MIASVLVPLAIFASFVAIANANKPFGAPSNQWRSYQGAIKNGELWFPVITRLNSDGTEYECRLKRIHLGSLQEFETGLSVRNDFLSPFWTEDGFCAATSTTLFRIDNGQLIKVCQRPDQSRTCYCNVFKYNGQLSSIAESPQGGYRLIHLVDGEWIEGESICLPGFDYEWQVEPESNRDVLVRKSSIQNSNGGLTRPLMLTVIEQAGQYHLFHSDQSTGTSYRTGFEFCDEKGSGISGEASPQQMDLTAWNRLETASTAQINQSVTADADGIFKVSPFVPRIMQARGARWSIQVMRAGKEWQELDGLERLNSPGRLYVIADPFGRTACAILEDQTWGAATFHRIESDRVQSAFHHIRGEMPTYLARWAVLGAGGLLAWASHILILVVGLRWLHGWKMPTQYGSGNRIVSLATPWERVSSGLVDLAVVSLIAIPLIAFQVIRLQGIHLRPLSELELCRFLFNLERELIEWISGDHSIDLRASYLVSVAFNQSSMIPLLIGEGMAGFVVWLGIQFYCRKTPGEWWTSTQVVRTDLRPCGIGAILIRTMFYWFDTPFFISPLPAFVSMAFSHQMQRWGDRVANTIVIQDEVRRA